MLKTATGNIFARNWQKLGLGLENRLLDKVGLLSGGQRQALTMLMATMIKPEVLLLDEHIAALDPKTASQILESDPGNSEEPEAHHPDDHP